MITLFFSIILALLSLKFYSKKEYASMLFCLTLIASDLSGFGLALGESPVKIVDIAIVVIVFIWMREFNHDRTVFNLNNDRLGKALLRLFVYITIVFIGTIILNQDSASNALKVYRMFLILPFYFVLRKMSVRDYEKYIRLMLSISCVQGFFYYLQFIGITGLLSGYGSDSTEPNARLGNYPFMADFFFLYYLFSGNISFGKKVFFLVFFGLMPVLGQMRGGILVMALSACIFFYYQRKAKYLLYIVMGYVAWSMIISPMFDKRADKGGISTKEEFAMVLNHPLDLYKYYTVDGQRGSFVFRLAMLGERVNFMIENPKYALTGVGCVHEQSPKNTYTMLIGTDLGEELSETSGTRPAYLGSADIVWVGVLMRFGFIGVLLVLSYYLLIYKLTHNNVRNNFNGIYLVYACCALPDIFASFNGNSFESVLSLITICGTSAFITIYNKQKSLVYDSNTH